MCLCRIAENLHFLLSILREHESINLIENCTISQLKSLVEITVNSSTFFEIDSVTQILLFFENHSQSSTLQVKYHFVKHFRELQVIIASSLLLLFEQSFGLICTNDDDDNEYQAVESNSG